MDAIGRRGLAAGAALAAMPKLAAAQAGPAKRKALYQEFQQIVTDDVPILFPHPFPYTPAAHKGLQGLPTTIWGPMSPYDEV